MVHLVGTCSLTISLNYVNVNVNYELSPVLLKKIEIASKGVF